MKALKVATNKLSEQGHSVYLVDPSHLSLNDPGFAPTEDALHLMEKVKEADAIILATPEYHGGYSSVIKRVIENLGFPSELSGKPVALLGVAAGQIGAIKSIESLRTVVSHVGGLVLPKAISIANVQGVFDEEGKPTDAHAEKALNSLASTIHNYLDQASELPQGKVSNSEAQRV